MGHEEKRLQYNLNNKELKYDNNKKGYLVQKNLKRR